MKNSTQEDACCADLEKKSLFRQPLFIILSIAAVVTAGLYFKWPTIVALGFAPIILALAPCTLVCALGMCGIGRSKNKAKALEPTQDSKS